MNTAAHITATAFESLRDDPTLTPEQRRGPANGIWCCAHHIRLIDADENAYPVEMLLRWKQKEQQTSALALGRLERCAPGATEDLESVDRARLSH